MSKTQKIAGASLAVASLAGIGASLASTADATLAKPYHTHGAYQNGYASKASCVSNYNGAMNSVRAHGGRIINNGGGCVYWSPSHKWTYWSFDYYSASYTGPGDSSKTYQQYYSVSA